MADCTRARVGAATVSGRLITFETVPTETPAARATSLIPTDWAIGQDLRGSEGAAGFFTLPARPPRERCRCRGLPGAGDVSGQVEDLGEGLHRLVGAGAVEGGEEGGHLRLPAGVDLGGLHRGTGGLEVLGLQVSDEEAVVGEEEGVV